MRLLKSVETLQPHPYNAFWAFLGFAACHIPWREIHLLSVEMPSSQENAESADEWGRNRISVCAEGLPKSGGPRWLPFAGLFALALILRLIRLGAKSLWDDEAAALYMVSMPLRDMFRFLLANDPHGPIYVLFPRLFGIGWGSSEFAIRLPHAVLGALAVVLTLAVLREFFSRSAALIGAGLMAVSPLYLQVSQEYRFYPLLLCLFLGSTLLSVRWLKGTIRTGVFIPAYVLVSLAGVYTDVVPFLGVFVFQWLCLWYWSCSRSKFLALLLLQAGACLCFAPWALSYLGGAKHGGYELFVGGQGGRIFASPAAQALMFNSTLVKALHALLFPTLDYWRSLKGTLSAESNLFGWLAFYLGALSAAASLALGIGERTGRSKSGITLCLVCALLLLAWSIVRLCRNADQGLWFGVTFLLPLALAGVIVFIPLLVSGKNNAGRSLGYFALASVLVLYGAKLLLPMDPRHFAIPFVFLLGHIGGSIEILWRHRVGRGMVLLLCFCVLPGLAPYYWSSVSIFHLQDYRSACKQLAAQEKKDVGAMYLNAGWGGLAAVRYYTGVRDGVFPDRYWIGPIVAEEADRQLDGLVKSSIDRTGVAHVLAVYRLDPSFMDFLRRMEEFYEVRRCFHGQEVIILTLTRSSARE